jgi:adenosylcobinamide kinase/adenosylcobinamide-phosphate guanylyltransferase
VCRDWAGPDVVLRALRAGEETTLASGHRVRAMPAEHDPSMGPPLLYDVDERLLVLWDTAAPLPPISGPPRDVVLLECTTGDGPDLPGHHGFTDFARSIARLRRDGAIGDMTAVVPVHLGHRNPHGAELVRRFAAIGATVLPDGATVRPSTRRASAPRRVLITGGARSGKSLEAERRVAGEPAVTYVATGVGHEGDPSWAERVALHRARRPPHWTTVETTDATSLLEKAGDGDVLLIDCATLWVAAHLGDPGYATAADALVAAWRGTRATAVLVTNEVGSGVHADSELGRRFSDELGRLNARLAAEADEVWLVVAGSPVQLR